MYELSYSFHIGNDKNKSKKSKEKIKNKIVKDKIFNDNAIKNLNDLSRANKHNLRKYDNKQELIEIIYGTKDIINDVKELYIQEFEDARIKFNEKQTRNDRKINDYFMHVSNNDKTDLACEIIIELGDMYFWKKKDLEYKKKMTEVFNDQIYDLVNLVPDFKIANATIHYDESSPHLHIVGVAVKVGNKNGMEKQVGKSTVLNKESLRMIQDNMRASCIKSFNKHYENTGKLKAKLKGRNLDYQTRDMGKVYYTIEKQIDKNRKRIENLNKKTNITLEKSQNIKELVSNLKSSKISKNNYIINDEQVKTIKVYIETVDNNITDIKAVDDLTIAIDNFEDFLKNNKEHVSNLQNTIDQQNQKIKKLEKPQKEKDKEIKELKKTILDLNNIINTWIELWKKLLKFIKEKLFSFIKDDNTFIDIINEMIDDEILNSDDIEYIEDYSTKKDDYEY